MEVTPGALGTGTHGSVTGLGQQEEVASWDPEGGSSMPPAQGQPRRHPNPRAHPYLDVHTGLHRGTVPGCTHIHNIHRAAHTAGWPGAGLVGHSPVSRWLLSIDMQTEPPVWEVGWPRGPVNYVGRLGLSWPLREAGQ